MSRKVFTAGQVLAAADVNSFLMDQSVMSFAGTAARGSAIGTAVEGMVTYLEDTNTLSVNNGTAWTTDRTIQVFAGTAARGSAVPSPFEGMYSHLNDTDALQYYNGTAWVNAAPAASGAVEFIATQSFTTQATVSFNSVFTSAYKNYKIILNIDSAGNSPTAVRMRLRASGADNTTSNYRVGRLYVGALNGEPAGNVNNALQTFFDLGGANQVFGGSSVIHVFSPQIAQYTKISAINSGQLAELGGGGFVLTTAFDGFTILLNTTTITGSCTVYGLKDS